MARWADIKQLPYYANYSYEDKEIRLQEYQLDGDVAAKLKSGEIVTPSVLTQLQRTKGEGPRDPKGDGIRPFPPRRTKEEIFNAKKFAQKDKYVKGVLPQPNEDDASFLDRLFHLCHSNLDIVRAAFVFVCEADVDNLQETSNESQLYTLVRELRDNNNETVLFARLLELRQVPFKQIWGLKKGIGFEAGKETEGEGPWFACYVEGEWRFVDAHWGSQHVADHDDGKFQQVSEGGEISGGGARSGRKVYQCNEYYFLTDPDKLVNTHLPPEEDKEWQLLVRPLTTTEYLQMPSFFDGAAAASKLFQLAPASHPFNVIPAAPGTIEIFLQELGDQQYEYATSLEISAKSITDEARKAIKDVANVNGYLTKAVRMGGGQVKFKFVPPCLGQFRLTISLKRVVEEGQHWITYTYTYVQHTIHCPQAAENVKQQPQGELPEFGAGALLAASGLSAEECGELKAADGEQQLVVAEEDGRQHRLKCRASNADGDLPDNNILLWRHESKNHFIFLAPDSGAYAMVVYDNGEPICQYLVDADSEARDGGMPLPDWNKFGGLGAIDQEFADFVHPVSHETPYIVSEEAELEIKLRVTVELEVRAKLLYLAPGGEERPADGFALVNGAIQGANVDVRFQQAGHYVLLLEARLPDSEEWRPFFNYFVRALGQLDGSAPEFPLVAANWSSANRIVLPKHRLLPINEVVKFNLHIKDPSIKFVYVINVAKDEKVGLLPDGEGTWKGELKGYKPSAGGDVIVTGGPDRDSCEELLRYRFEAPADKEQQEKRRQDAEELNRQREENEQRRRRKQENHQRQDKGQEALPEDPVEEERKRKEEEEQRKQQEEEKRKQREEEANAKKQQQEQERRERAAKEKKEAEDKRKRDEEEKKKQQEEERQRQQEEDQRKKEEKRQEQQEQQRQKEERQRQRREDEKKKKVQAKEYYMDKLQRKEEEKKRRKEEKRKKREEKEKKEKEEKKKRKLSRQRSENLTTILSKKVVNEGSLKSAVKEMRSAGAQNQEEEEMLTYGERYLDMLQLKTELANENKKAEDSGDAKPLAKVLKKIDDEKFSNGLLEKMKPEMDRAKQLQQQQSRGSRQPQHRMDCDSKAMTELKRYSNPPAIVTKTVQGVLLLLGHYEVKTRNWSRCQKLLATTLKDINNGEPKKPHPAIVARAEQILTGVNRQELASSSPAAAALLDWALPKVQNAKSNSKGGSAKPADLKQQRKILNVTTEEHDEYVFQDEGKK